MSTSFNLPKHTPTTSDNAGAAFLSLPRFSSRYGVIHLSSSCPLRLLNLLSQFFIVILNPVLSVVSYSFAAQSMLTPFAGLSIVWSLLFSSLLLPESIDSRKYRSTVLITLYPFLHSQSTFTMQRMHPHFPLGNAFTSDSDRG